MTRSAWVRWIASAVFIGGVPTACGRYEGMLSETKASYENMSWYFQCPTDQNPIVVPAPGPRQLIVEGPGPIRLVRERMVGTPIDVIGRVCPPQRMMRDILFVLDVSISMSSNDPLRNNSCGRLEAMNAVLDRLPAGIANFGIVTFDSVIRHQSDRFYDNKDALYDHITGGNRSNIKDVACAITGGTSYIAAFNGARTVFQRSRPNATKELFFITDGQPFDDGMGPDWPAVRTLASELRTQGVTIDGQVLPLNIATVMLGSVDDTFLRSLASTGSNGQPVHARVTDSAGLANVFADLADNRLVGSSLSHGAAGDALIQVDIMPHLQNYSFRLPQFLIGIDGSQTGYEMNFEYWDVRRNRFRIDGRIIWSD
jgi:hypothetical protein